MKKTNRSEKTISKKPGRVRAVWLAAAAVVAVGGYAGAAAFFSGHFLPRTYINGVSAAGKTVEDLADELNSRTEAYSLTITDGDGRTLGEIAAEDIDFTITADTQALRQMKDGQSAAGWIAHLFSDEELQSESLYAYDEEKLQTQAARFAAALPEGEEPADAFLWYDGETQRFFIVPEQEGSAPDAQAVEQAILSAVASFDETLDLSAADCWKKPEVTAEDEALTAKRDRLNGVLETGVVYTVGSAREEVPAERIASWLSLDEAGQVTVSREGAAAFVAEMADKYNTVGKSHALATSYGTTVNVAAGDYGWQIDQEAETDQLVADLLSGTHTERDFVYALTAASHDGSDFGNSYVEINLTAQHLYLYKDGNRVLDTAICSGDVATGDATPVGAYRIKYCARNVTLRGPGYASPVSYWMPFNGGVGLHDAPWKTAFGGQIYKTNGSHGCINLMIPMAKQIYETVSAGYPVLVYELAGTESSVVSDRLHNVMAKIDNIEEVTLAKASAISSARAAYEGLSADLKAACTNLNKLEAAEARLAQLQEEERIRQEEEARRWAEILAAVQAQNQADADRVSAMIAPLGDVTPENALTRSGEIDAAVAAYNELSQDARYLVTNLATLQNAQRTRDEAVAAQNAPAPEPEPQPEP